LSRRRSSVHTPVLRAEVVEALARAVPDSDAEVWIVDGTLGMGGHTRLILDALPNARVLGIDQDPDALELACAALAPFDERVRACRARISDLGEVLDNEGISAPTGMLFDLGASSLQFDRPGRGFSLQADGPLDMRMDPDLDRTAAEIINDWDEGDLADLFYHEGGERRSRSIARAIVEARRRAPFLRTMALAEVIAAAQGGPSRVGRIHPATRCFQALRRAVNQEGDELLAGLALAQERLADGGVLCVISFHSGEDGVVKRFFKEGAKVGDWRLGSRRAVQPSRVELLENPRSRSARMRWGIRTLKASTGQDGGGE